MFSLTIALGNVAWQLLYTEQAKAEEAYSFLTGEAETIGLADDFGQRLQVRRENIDGCLFEDLDKSALARIEMGIHMEKLKVRAGQMAENDPVLKQARMRASMGVLSPMGMGPVPGLAPNGRG